MKLTRFAVIGSIAAATTLVGCANVPTGAAAKADRSAVIHRARTIEAGMLGNERADLRTSTLQLGAGDAYGEMVHTVYLAYLVRDELEAYAEAQIMDAPE